MKDFETLNVYAIVVTYNGQKWVDKCFGSLSNSNIPVKIIAIDNGSTDSTCNLIAKKFPEVSILKSDVNIGFGKANNIGLREAKKNNADYVVLLNQDAWYEKNTLETIIKLAKKYPNYGVLSGIHLDAEMKELDYNFSKQVNPESCPYFISDQVLNKAKDIYEINFVNAAFWVITKKCLEETGFFEPLFFMYGEDDNYLHRVHFHNYKVGITPLARICHDRKSRARKKNINLYETKVNYLKYVLNPNNQFIKVYINLVLRIGAKSFIYFVKFQWRQAINALVFLVQTLLSYRKYIIARKAY
jgi:GT2 family glycosyltransferase